MGYRHCVVVLQTNGWSSPPFRLYRVTAGMLLLWSLRATFSSLTFDSVSVVVVTSSAKLSQLLCFGKHGVVSCNYALMSFRVHRLLRDQYSHSESVRSYFGEINCCEMSAHILLSYLLECYHFFSRLDFECVCIKLGSPEVIYSMLQPCRIL